MDSVHSAGLSNPKLGPAGEDVSKLMGMLRLEWKMLYLYVLVHVMYVHTYDSSLNILKFVEYVADCV